MGMREPIRGTDVHPSRGGATELIDRFCRACVSYHETRVRFLPGEAPELTPPACYFEATVHVPGWCGGANYREDIP
jgi:hypothetical protein